MPDEINKNPLLSTDFLIPFADIRAEHVKPAVAEILRQAHTQMERIIHVQVPRTYQNTLGALEDMTVPLETVMNVVGHLESTVSTSALRNAYNAVQPDTAAFFAQIPLSEGLWQALQAFAATPNAKQLSPTKKRLLQKTLDDFRRHGAELREEPKKRLLAIDKELSQLTTHFAQNVLDATNAFELVITDPKQLSGLPASAVEAALENAKAHKVEGWRFTLQAPSYIALMTYLDNRDIREHMWRAFQGRGAAEKYDNRPLIRQILALRSEKAKLLKYDNFADLVLADRMAKTGATAKAFLADLEQRIRPIFARENADLQDFCRQLERSPTFVLQPWDIAYYSEKQRRAHYDYDEEALRPYFPLPSVLAGMFDIAQRLYSIRITPTSEFPTWHPDVQTFKVHDQEGNFVGGFYTDFYPRDNKRDGAWMNGLRTGIRSKDAWTPHLGLICANVTPAVGDAPPLLRHSEVEVLFHEFGHLLHHLLSEVEVRSLAGTNVAWDFVELPSQIMENWCWERSALDLFARHYQSGDPLPDELLTRMLRARNHRSANQAMRQLGFAMIDLKLHSEYDPNTHGDVMEYSRNLIHAYSPAPLPEDYAMLASFSHLFASPVGYAAGYYSYKWAEVLDADAFTRFKQEGLLNPEVGSAFRSSILKHGDSQNPLELFRQFMHRDPNPEALLERANLLISTPATVP